MRLIAIFALVLAGLLAAAPATAQVKITGLFVAKDSCAAVQSIKKQTNPGDIRLQRGKGYKLIGQTSAGLVLGLPLGARRLRHARLRPARCVARPSLDRHAGDPVPAGQRQGRLRAGPQLGARLLRGTTGQDGVPQ